MKNIISDEMKLTDRVEEILETLWVLTVEEKKGKCDYSILRDDEVIKELKNLGYIRVLGNQIQLTGIGMEEAKNCVRRHRLAERLLKDVLDIKKKSLHETACKFEHLLHRGLEENICTILGHPKTCPHGMEIPEGPCCRDIRKEQLKKIIMPLIELKPGKKVKVSYLHTEDLNNLQKLLAMGILPDVKIVLIQKFPTFVLQIAKSQFAIDKELASHIYVRGY